MKMIIGLGNPGKEYAQTKHNVGFMVVDAIADELNVSVEKRQCQAFIQMATWDGEKILLVKPQKLVYLQICSEEFSTVSVNQSMVDQI